MISAPNIDRKLDIYIFNYIGCWGSNILAMYNESTLFAILFLQSQKLIFFLEERIKMTANITHPQMALKVLIIWGCTVDILADQRRAVEKSL